MKYFNVFSSRDYEENGETKRVWYKVGFIKETDNGGRFLTMFHQPDTSMYIFDQDERE